MFKSIQNITLSLLILMNGMTYSAIQLDFSINRERIAELFCINQNKPELSCKGKCELTRRLETAHDQEEDKKTFVQDEIISVYILPTQLQSPSKVWYQFHSKYEVLNKPDFIFINTSEFFRPPQI